MPISRERANFVGEAVSGGGKSVTVIENCALYLPRRAVDFMIALPPGKVEKGLFGPPTAFAYSMRDTRVQLGLRYRPEIDMQLNGFCGYVSQLPNTEKDRGAAIDRIQTVEVEIGVRLSQPIALEGDVFEALRAFTFAHGGFIFVQDSILTEEGYLVGPASHPQAVMTPAASVQVEMPDYGAHASEAARAVRAATATQLRAAGFQPASNLPFPNTEALLRPKEEIAGRLCALLNLFLIVAAPEERFPELALRQAIEAQDLTRFLTEDEAAILALSRADAHDQHVNAIGWRLENMLPLAWLIGMDLTPSITAEMAGGEEINAMIKLLPETDAAWSAYLDTLTLRSVDEAIALEDLFYCAHNAVRSAQMGQPTVPRGFNPMGNGGVIHERRHALTWALSPGVDWDETDLST